MFDGLYRKITIMNKIVLTQDTWIQIESADLITANTSFYHVDRIAPFNVLIYCIKGNIYVAEDDIPYSVGPGECLILKNGHHQSPTARIEAGTSWIYAHFYTREVAITSEAAEDTMGIVPGIYIPKHTTNLIGTNTENLLYRLIDSIHSTKQIDRLRISYLFNEILISLYEDSQEYVKPDLPEEIAKFLETCVREHVSTRQLENRFHLSYKYMERIFCRETGTSIMQYHTKLRIRECAKDLRSTTLSIAQISDMYGFSDQLYFSRCFKKHMGTSPQKYRINQMTL